MNVKWTTIFNLICSLMNMLHIYQICDEYFRYDVTTNVVIGLPDPVHFPSLTLCVNLVDVLKWEQMSSGFIRRLLNFTEITIDNEIVLSEFNETVVSKLINNRKQIRDQIRQFSEQYFFMYIYIYNNLVKEKTMAEILNLTEGFEHVFGYFSTTGRALQDADAENPKQAVYRLSNASDFQFSLDMVFIHNNNKCFTINIRPDLKKFSFKQLSDMSSYDLQCNLMSWVSDFGSDVEVKLHGKGYLIGVKDVMLIIEPLKYARTTFVTHESILLEYPYKSNCRDYTKTGLLSQKHCYEMCLKSKTVDKWRSIIPESHAFETDKISLGEGLISVEVKSRTIFASRACNIECSNRDCQSVIFFVDNKKKKTKDSLDALKFTYAAALTPESSNTSVGVFPEIFNKSLDNLLGQKICPAKKVATRIETQACISLISFLTSVFSTFGFWLGLSVSSSIPFVKEIWTNILNRQRTQDPIQIHRQFNSYFQQLNLFRQRMILLRRRQLVVSVQTKSGSNFGQRLTQNRVHVSTVEHIRN